MLWSTIQLAMSQMRRNLLRSFLTMLGIVIGVAAVITMVTLGNGATQAVSNQIAAMGSNLLMMRPGQNRGPGREDGKSSPPFRLGDVEAIREQIGSVKAVAPTNNASAVVVAGARNWSTSITGTQADYFTISNRTIASGRIFTASEEKAGKAVCVVGETVRAKLFGLENPVGSSMRIGSFSCEIVGLMAPKGTGGMGQDQDDLVVMPIRTVQRRMSGNDNVAGIQVSARDGIDTSKVEDQLTRLFRERRHIAEGAEDNFDVFDTKEIAQTLSGTTKVLTGLLGAVAAVSLLVGGIGIMNIMLVSVTERTREIGTRLAIGALEDEVLLQFLVEAVTLSSVGGLAGLALAAGGSMALAKLMGLPYLFDLKINVVAFLFSAAIGVGFGYLPARRAASLDPIEALRHE